jgi:hypothetical protein
VPAGVLRELRELRGGQKRGDPADRGQPAKLVIASQLRGRSPELVIRPGETVVIVGKPGAGKTLFARWLLDGVFSSVMYETKGDERERREWESAGFVRCTHPDELAEHARAMLVCQRSWLLDRRHWASPRHPWSLALEHPFGRVPSALLFDEVLNVFPGTDGHPGTHRLLQQGRSAGMVSILLTQMATGVDTRLWRLAQHHFVLGPVQLAEQGHVAAATGIAAAVVRGLGRHEIAHRHEEADAATVYQPVDLEAPGRLERRPTPSETMAAEYRRRSAPWWGRHRPAPTRPLTELRVL